MVLYNQNLALNILLAYTVGFIFSFNILIFLINTGFNSGHHET
jgi:hypothetical protein